MEPIKLGFVGGGGRSRSLWQSLISSEEMEENIHPKAVLDTNNQTLKSWEYLVDNQYDNLDSFLKDDLDAIIIGTPPATHAPIAVRALELGLDVWSEVPMGLSMNELYNIIDARKTNKGTKGRYCYGENYCYFMEPQFVAMKNRKNALGDIYYLEGEYTHSVEHYMIEENFLKKVAVDLDPELHPETKPTWRADFPPLKYGHACGPCLYVLNQNSKGIIERPTEVSAMGNMKMQKRFNTQNFQIAMVKTSEDTIIKFVIGFVLGHHGRIFISAWGSQGLFVGGSFQTKDHFYYEVPPEKAHFPERHNQESQVLTREDLKEMGVPHAEGGHEGGDVIMFETWIDTLVNNKPMDIDVFRAAEMTAPGILAMDAIEQKKTIEIPRFD